MVFGGVRLTKTRSWAMLLSSLNAMQGSTASTLVHDDGTAACFAPLGKTAAAKRK